MTLGGTAIDPQFESVLEKDLSEILADSHYRDMCLVKMGDVIQYNEKCRECKYRLQCGAGCRACGVGEYGTDYLAIDEECCNFFQNGWYEKALEQVEKYKDYFPKRDKTIPQPESKPQDC